jgi:hypothetical protein
MIKARHADHHRRAADDLPLVTPTTLRGVIGW